MNVKRIWKWMILAGVVLLALAVLIPIVVVQVSKAFTAQEQAARTDWTFSTGDVVAQSSQWQVDLTEADLGDGLKALQLVPQDIEDEDFTYYDEDVQQRLGQQLMEMAVEKGRRLNLPVYRFLRFPIGAIRARLYFDHNQFMVLLRHDVQFQMVFPPVAMKKDIPLAFQIGRSGIFSGFS